MRACWTGLAEKGRCGFPAGLGGCGFVECDVTEGVGGVCAGLVIDQVGAGGGDGARGVEESQKGRHPLRPASRATSSSPLWGGDGGGEGFCGGLEGCRGMRRRGSEGWGAPHPGPLPPGEREEVGGKFGWGEAEVVGELGDGEGGVGEEVEEGDRGTGRGQWRMGERTG